MDDRLHICLWMIGGGALGSGLGVIFGGLSAMMFARSGHAAGTGLARRIADAFERTAEQEPSPLGCAVFIGAVDGVLFLGILGLVAGALLGASGRTAHELLLPALVGSVALFGGAIFFGLLAYAMSRGAHIIVSVIAFGLFGAFLVALTFGVDRLLLGVVPGFFVGLLFSLAARRYSPTFRTPQIGKTVRYPRSDSDITRSPHSPSDVDFFRKPDSFEE